MAIWGNEVSIIYTLIYKNNISLYLHITLTTCFYIIRWKNTHYTLFYINYRIIVAYWFRLKTFVSSAVKMFHLLCFHFPLCVLQLFLTRPSALINLSLQFIFMDWILSLHYLVHWQPSSGSKQWLQDFKVLRATPDYILRPLALNVLEGPKRPEIGWCPLEAPHLRVLNDPWLRHHQSTNRTSPRLHRPKRQHWRTDRCKQKVKIYI